jgi:hypothetical protein
MKCISYSIFGAGKERHENCDTVNSYMRGLAICLRMNRLLYPDWEIVINTDNETYEAFKGYFAAIKNDKVKVQANDSAELCRAMLWRLKPIFEMENGAWKYTHVICRDTDSPATYREVQAVQYWIDKDKACHAITDSVSHVIPLMGGMVGFRPAYFSSRTGWHDFDELMRRGGGISFSNKGSDQDFLNQVVYPKFAQHGSDSITQHYFNGHANTFLSDFHTCTCPPPSGHREDCPNNYKIDLPDELKESNSICGHIGSAGAYQSAVERFLRKYRDQFDDLHSAEEKYPDVFYWTKDKSLG